MLYLEFEDQPKDGRASITNSKESNKWSRVSTQFCDVIEVFNANDFFALDWILMKLS